MPSERTRSAVRVRLPRGGVFVFESRHARGFQTTVLRHRYLKVLLVLHGQVQVRAGHRRFDLQKGDVLHVPPGVSHALVDHPDRPATLLACCAGMGPLRRPAVKDIGLRLFVSQPAVRSAVEGLLRRMHIEQFRQLPQQPLLLQSLADELLVTLARAPVAAAAPISAGAQRVSELADRLQREFFHPVSLDEAASAARLSRRRLTDLFRLVTGQTFHERMQSLRMEHAQRLLATTDDSVTTIAFACGYGELSTFYRAFARSVGCSPLQYRHTRLSKAASGRARYF